MSDLDAARQYLAGSRKHLGDVQRARARGMASATDVQRAERRGGHGPGDPGRARRPGVQ